MQPVIQTIELTKIYRDFWGRGHVCALEGLDLEVQRGEVFGLLGPNGSGKTTTVKLLLGLLFPTRGLIRVFGKPPGDVDVKKRIGYMPEESHLYDYLNARETLDFFGRLFGLTRNDRKSRADALIDMVGLARARNRPAGEFSKGMARRLGLAQALVNDPDLLILDEPTTGLDPIGSREMKDLIVALKERGKTVFLCSHLLSDVEQICDHIAILYGGKMRISGTVSELLREEELLRMTLPPLPKQAIDELISTVKRYAPESAGCEISASERRLEDFFLNVVQQARKEHVATAGAESGTGAAEFLSPADAPEKLIEELTRPGKQPAEKKTADVTPVPAPDTADAENLDLITKLAERTPEAKKNGDRAVDPAPEAMEETERPDLLRQLVGKEGRERKGRSGGEEEESSEGAGE